MEYYKSLDECIPDGQDFQNWIMRTHLKINPKIIEYYNNKIKLCGENLMTTLTIDFCEIVDNKSESDDDMEKEDEIQPHCFICFNMNMNLNVNCFNCDKIYCKSHSYCILGDDDMPYCSKECFINC